MQVFGKEAFGKVGKYFRALRFTCEGEGKHKLVGAASLPTLTLLVLFPSLGLSSRQADGHTVY